MLAENSTRLFTGSLAGKTLGQIYSEVIHWKQVQLSSKQLFPESLQV